jgi:hypothetical protein
MPRNAKPRGSTRVESIKHKDSRANIPTEELRDFVREDAVKVINHYGDEVLKVFEV